MNKHYIYGLAASLVIAAVAFCGCSNEDLVADIQTPALQAPAYHISIPASILGDTDTRAVAFGTDGTSITSTFDASDEIYVTLERESSFLAFGHSGQGGSFTKLSVVPDASDASKASLYGIVKFSKYDLGGGFIKSKELTRGDVVIGGRGKDEGTWESVEPWVGDVVHLYCGHKSRKTGEGELEFDYSNQDGSASNVTGAGSCDFSEAKLKIKSISGNETDGYVLTLCQLGEGNEDKSTAQFENVGSMFRFQLSFKDKNNQSITKIPVITKLKCYPKNNTLAELFAPKSYSIYEGSEISIRSSSNILDENGNLYLSMMFKYDDQKAPADDDQLIIIAEDTDGNVYQCTKDVPDGGFLAGKYYYSTIQMNWMIKYEAATVTRNDTGEEIELDEENSEFYIDKNSAGDPIDVTLSGNHSGYSIYVSNWQQMSYMTFTGNGTATYVQRGSRAACIVSYSDLTVNLDGNYTLKSLNSSYGLYCDETLKLKGNGTLTVTVKDANSTGLYADNNYNSGSSSDVSALADEGYTVMRSARTDNGDGTYTWVYTVAPVQ